MKFSEFFFFKQSVKVFIVGRIFFWRFVPIDVKKLLTFFAILIGSVIVFSSAIIVDTLLTFFSAKYDSMYALLYCFEVFFVQLKMMLFTLPCLFNYFFPVVFIWLMLDQVLLLIFLLLSSVYKVYLFSSLKFWCF